MVFSKNTPMIKSEKEKVYREKLTSCFWMNFCVYLWIMSLLSFIVVFGPNGQ